MAISHDRAMNKKWLFSNDEAAFAVDYVTTDKAAGIVWVKYAIEFISPILTPSSSILMSREIHLVKNDTSTPNQKIGEDDGCIVQMHKNVTPIQFEQNLDVDFQHL